MRLLQEKGAVALILSTTLALTTMPVTSDDDIAFPADYSQWVLYATYNEAGNRPELLATGQLRELYATRATLDAAKAGGPLPDGTVWFGFATMSSVMPRESRLRTPKAG